MVANYLSRAFVIILFPHAAVAAIACSVAVSGVAFPSYDVFNTLPTDSSGTANVTCADVGGGGGLTIDLSVGISPSATSGTTANRQMAAAGVTDRLNYNLYRDPAYTLVWGNQPGLDDYTVAKVKVPKNGSVPLPLTIFARIPPGQDVVAGSYADTVVLTVTP